MEFKREFTSIVKGENFMTPKVIKYLRIDDYVVEIAKGEFLRKDIYGVSVVDTVNKKARHDLSEGGFRTLGDALEYANSLVGVSDED